jgi:peptidoglycan/LPS O-acetylase OafA/YrhL
MRRSFGQILSENRGAGPGFDFLRLALALAILLAHLAAIGQTRGILGQILDLVSSWISGAPALAAGVTSVADVVPSAEQATPLPGGLVQPGLSRPIVLSHVPMFFALSGFLVTGSAFRARKVGPFLALRFLRIFPALCVEVALSALIIGVVFTTLPLSDYFQAPLFWSYFGNIAGFVQMELPGVLFSASGDKHALNANLWTLPSEFHSYAILSVLMFSGIAFRRTAFSILFAAATLFLIFLNIAFDYNSVPAPSGSMNVYYFFMGVMFYLWRDEIPYNGLLCAGAAAASYFLIVQPHGVYIAPALLTYVTMFIGLSPLPRSRLLQSGDYSYGIYLYGYPISQALVQTFPTLRGNFFALLVPAVILTGVFAFFSWHAIEKHFLKLKKHFSIGSAKITEQLHPAAMRASASPSTNGPPRLPREIV